MPLRMFVIGCIQFYNVSEEGYFGFILTVCVWSPSLLASVSFESSSIVALNSNQQLRLVSYCCFTPRTRTN